jgi:hypothetical protein
LRRHEQAHAKAGKTGELKGSKPTATASATGKIASKVPKKKAIRRVKEEEEIDEEEIEPPRKITRTTKRQLATKPISSAESSQGGEDATGEQFAEEDDYDEDNDEELEEDDADDYDPNQPDGRSSRMVIDRGIGTSRLAHSQPSLDDWSRPGLHSSSSYTRVPSTHHPYSDQQQQQQQQQQQSFYHSPIEYANHPPSSLPPFRIANSSFGSSQFPHPQSPLGLSSNSHAPWDGSSQPTQAKSSFDFLGLVASASYLSDNEAPSQHSVRHLPTVPDASLRLDLSDPILQNVPLSFYNHLPPHSSLHRLHDSAADTLLSLSAPRTPPRSSPELEDVVRGSHMNTDVWPTAPIYRPSNLNNTSNGLDMNNNIPAPTSIQYVARVTQATRDRLVKTVVRDLAIVNAVIPSLELVDLFVGMFFERYQSLFPMIHVPTFDPNEAPSYLLLAITSIGARYSYRRVESAAEHAKSLLEIARKTLLILVRCRTSFLLRLN